MGQIYPKEKSRITLDGLLSITDLSDAKTFLDFGGNKGNLLSFPDFNIAPENYTCVDVDRDVLLMGAENTPTAKFVYYNRYSNVYNTGGKKGYNFPDVSKDQDVIFAFSVFTHTDFNELKATLEWFKTFNYKKIIISLLDLNRPIHLDLFYKRRLEQYGSAIDIRKFEDCDAEVLYYINNNTVVTDQDHIDPTPYDFLLTFYNLDYIRSVFDCRVEIHNNYPFMVIHNDSI